MAAVNLPEFAAGLPAARVDASLRQALSACDRARECAALWFTEVQRRELYRTLGYASLQLYATQALGFSDNRYWQFKRLADDLDRLPALREAVADGEIGWTKAQLVARVATPATEALWVEKAVTTGRRELAAAVKAVRADKLAPAQVAAPATIALRADALRLARFEALLETIRKQRRLPPGADRLDIVLAGLEELVGAADGECRTSAAPAQVIVHRCPDCAAATVTTGRGEQPLAPAQVAALACDAQVRAPGQPNRATIKPSVRAAVLARERHRCATPGCRSAHFLEVHHVIPRSRGGSNRAENLITLCSRCHAHAHVANQPLAPAQVAARGRAAGDTARPRAHGIITGLPATPPCAASRSSGTSG